MANRREFLLQTAVAGALVAPAMGRSQPAAGPAGDRAGNTKRSAAAPAESRSAGSLKSYTIPGTGIKVSRLAFGTAGIVGWDTKPIGADDLARTTALVNTAMEQGVTLFDHADLYAFGKCEQVFGTVLKQSPGLRDRMVLQSKCGQRFVKEGEMTAGLRVDLTRQHILSAVEGSLKRLGTDRLDILLLHAADALVEPDEVAQAFDELHRGGKVLQFGVSNYDAAQIALLRGSVRQPLVVNQIPIGLARPDAIADGLEFTSTIGKGKYKQSENGVEGTLSYCRLNGIQVQAYSPLRGVLNAPADAPEKIKRAVEAVSKMAQAKQTTPAVVALAWLLRHPAGILPIMGGDKPQYIVENCAADRLSLSRDEWYDLFLAAA